MYISKIWYNVCQYLKYVLEGEKFEVQIMAENEKLKILYLMKILMEETDKEHILNALEICEILDKRYGISSSRKTVYGDVERLREYGVKIGQNKGKNQGYYIEEREFSLPELKLLVDAVQSSNFITNQKSAKLIGKLEKLTSKENAKQLQRQVYIYNRAKTENETIFNNVDLIHRAIQENRQIEFQYAEWTPKKELRLKRDGAKYHTSPWSLTWTGENYYLVAADISKQTIRHYRVDKMQNITLMKEQRTGREQFEGFDLAEFSKKTFGMYSGKDTKVTLLCDNYLAGVIFDRFGKEPFIIPANENQFKASVLVSVSPQFFGWVAGVGNGMEILGPQEVRDDYKKYLKDMLDKYQE